MKTLSQKFQEPVLYINLAEMGSNVHPDNKGEWEMVVGQVDKGICYVTYLHMVFYSYAYVVDNVPNYEQHKMSLPNLTGNWLYS